MSSAANDLGQDAAPSIISPYSSTMIQEIRMYDEFFLTDLVVQADITTNWIAPVIVNKSEGVDLCLNGTVDYRVLKVPFDNNQWITFTSSGINGAGESYEVSAFFDNNTRNGLVLGSLTHDTWKTGISYTGANNRLDKLVVYGGASSKITRDTCGRVVCPCRKRKEGR